VRAQSGGDGTSVQPSEGTAVWWAKDSYQMVREGQCVFGGKA
jgi:hypothetical protein